MKDLLSSLRSAGGRIIGTIVGLVIGLLWAMFGFWKTAFIILCAVAGYLVGKALDGDEGLETILRRLLPLR
ncbi:MAG: DUF2273 domain-containing protein [Firmicutes bacterium]|nr:DUF2273 domain-containing protein [Bacillota bacterium]